MYWYHFSISRDGWKKCPKSLMVCQYSLSAPLRMLAQIRSHVHGVQRDTLTRQALLRITDKFLRSKNEDGGFN